MPSLGFYKTTGHRGRAGCLNLFTNNETSINKLTLGAAGRVSNIKQPIAGH